MTKSLSIESIFNCFFLGDVRRLGKFLGLTETLFVPKKRTGVWQCGG